MFVEATVGRDSSLDAEMSILENQPTETYITVLKEVVLPSALLGWICR